jgi:lipopolysaccharide/colanic/teichoic acid biosynthesis glycosyltransferase
MRIALTGAKGLIAGGLIKDLSENHDLILVSRVANTTHDEKNPPGRVEYMAMDEFLIKLPDLQLDILLHLAVVNNNQSVSKSEFTKVNVDLTLDLAKRCASNKVKFIFFSSTHALTPGPIGHYALSKKVACDRLHEIPNLECWILHLPAVIPLTAKVGRFSIFRFIPERAKFVVLSILRLFRPFITLDALAEFLKNELDSTGEEEMGVYYVKNIMVGGLQYSGFLNLWGYTSSLILAVIATVPVFFTLGFLWIAFVLTGSRDFIFRQNRVGLWSKPFTVYKIRTMAPETAERPTHEVSRSQVTRMGRFLRRARIDELPQCINLLKGEMTFVGPRPCLTTQSGLIAERVRRGILEIPPGITGWAQVWGVDMSDVRRLTQFDEYYLRYRTVGLDLKIICHTLLPFGRKDYTSD